MHLGNGGVVRIAHVRLAVGEEVVDDHSDDGEEEDNKTPEDLVRDGAVGLEDLDCRFVSIIRAAGVHGDTHSRQGCREPKR